MVLGNLVKSTIRAVLAIALCIGTIAVITMSRDNAYFPITSVKVFGIQHATPSTVQSTVAPLVSQSFFTLNIEAIKDRLLQMPWVEQVIVRRIWPSQVTIILKEKKAIARWNDTSLLSDGGQLFTPELASYPEGLPSFNGPPGSQLMMAKNFTKIMVALRPLRANIVQLAYNPAAGWTIVLDNGIKLNIGRKDSLTRLSHFVKVYPQIVGEQVASVEYVDLRYPNGVAVKWKSNL